MQSIFDSFDACESCKKRQCFARERISLKCSCKDDGRTLSKSADARGEKDGDVSVSDFIEVSFGCICEVMGYFDEYRNTVYELGFNDGETTEYEFSVARSNSIMSRLAQNLYLDFQIEFEGKTPSQRRN